MLFLQLWLIGSIGFVLGWVVRSALAKVRAQNPTDEVRTIDLRTLPQRGNSSRGRRVASGAEKATDAPLQINLN
jgi:hypothetical protein